MKKSLSLLLSLVLLGTASIALADIPGRDPAISDTAWQGRVPFVNDSVKEELDFIRKKIGRLTNHQVAFTKMSTVIVGLGKDCDFRVDLPLQSMMYEEKVISNTDERHYTVTGSSKEFQVQIQKNNPEDEENLKEGKETFLGKPYDTLTDEDISHLLGGVTAIDETSKPTAVGGKLIKAGVASPTWDGMAYGTSYDYSANVTFKNQPQLRYVVGTSLRKNNIKDMQLIELANYVAPSLRTASSAIHDTKEEVVGDLHFYIPVIADEVASDGKDIPYYAKVSKDLNARTFLVGNAKVVACQVSHPKVKDMMDAYFRGFQVYIVAKNDPRELAVRNSMVYVNNRPGLFTERLMEEKGAQSIHMDVLIPSKEYNYSINVILPADTPASDLQRWRDMLQTFAVNDGYNVVNMDIAKLTIYQMMKHI